MTRKLNKFVDDRKTCLDEKDLLMLELNKQKNRLEMEKVSNRALIKKFRSKILIQESVFLSFFFS